MASGVWTLELLATAVGLTEEALELVELVVQIFHSVLELRGVGTTTVLLETGHGAQDEAGVVVVVVVWDEGATGVHGAQVEVLEEVVGATGVGEVVVVVLTVHTCQGVWVVVGTTGLGVVVVVVGTTG